MKIRFNVFVIIACAIAFFSLGFLIFFTTVFLHRLGLPYNDQGRYFCLENDVPIVYLQQSVLVYGLSSLISLVIFVTTVMLLIRVAVKTR